MKSRIRFNLRALGGGLLAAGPILMQFGPAKSVWWIGYIFLLAGPVLLGLEFRK